MKTPEKTNGGANGTATAVKNNSKTNVQTVNRPSIPGKDKDNANETGKTEPEKGAEAAPSPSAETKTPANEQHPAAIEPPKGEEVKTETKHEAEVRYIKPALNLEQTVKAVEGLHRKNIQRLALIARIKTLEAFEVNLIEESDELERNPYSGCKLIIRDDKGREFVTNTPGLIQMVSQFIYDACTDKLAEIEAEIVFPNVA